MLNLFEFIYLEVLCS